MEVAFLHNLCVPLILGLVGLYVLGCVVRLDDCD